MSREGTKDSVKTGTEADFLPEPSPDTLVSSIAALQTPQSTLPITSVKSTRSSTASSRCLRRQQRKDPNTGG
jgi:hypothetical protein